MGLLDKEEWLRYGKNELGRALCVHKEPYKEVARTETSVDVVGLEVLERNGGRSRRDGNPKSCRQAGRDE